MRRTRAAKGKPATTLSGAAESRFAWWRGQFPVAEVALAASLAGLLNQFVIDDVSLIQENVRAHGLAHWREILTSAYWPPPFAPELYRPITSLLMAIEYALGGGGPLIYRLVSYGLYAACAVMVLGLASRLLPRRVAVAVAVLFAAHPVHVEAVALGVNQGELLVGIIAVVMVRRYVDARRDGALPVREWVTLAALYAVAALIKEQGFVLPMLLLAAEWLLVARAPSRVGTLWRGYLSLAAVGAALLLVRAAVLSGNVAGAIPAEALAGLGVGGRTLTMLQVVPMWLRLLAWPAHLQVDYSPDEIVASSGFGVHEAAGLGLVLGAILVVSFARRRLPVLSFGLVWCAIALFPVSNILVPTGIVLAERSLFLPSVGFLFAAGAAGAALLKAAKGRAVLLAPALAAGCAILALAGIARSAERQRAWRNSAHFWLVSSRDAPRSKRLKRVQSDAVAALVQEFTTAIAKAPQPWLVRNELALRLRYMGEDSAAAAQLRASLAENAGQRDARIDLAATLLALGRYAEARQVADSAMQAGDSSSAFRTLKHLADSAEASRAPAGSIRITMPRSSHSGER